MSEKNVAPRRWNADAVLDAYEKGRADGWDQGMKAGLDNGIHLGEAAVKIRSWPDGPPANPYRGTS